MALPVPLAAFLLLNLLVLPCGRIGAQLSLAIRMDPSPSPYISDWRSNPNTVQFIVTNPLRTPALVRFDGFIEGDARGRVAETIREANIPPVSVPPGTMILNGVDAHFLEEGAVRFMGTARMETARRGRLPEDNFRLCVRLLAYDAPYSSLSADVCTRFDIRLVPAPSLISPADTAVVTAFPAFQWSMVPLGRGSMAEYELMVVELDPGQKNIHDAFQTNIPLLARRTSLPVYQYLPSDPPLSTGRGYAWRVQAIDPQERYSFANNGLSEARSFRYGPATAAAPAPAQVNDGLAADSDWTRYNTALSANWTSVQGAVKYLYAIGGTPGGTDILGWTDAGKALFYTKTDLKLSHSSTYFQSVKAVGAEGKESVVSSSDGIRVDTSKPSSMVSIPLPAGKATALLLNTTSFLVAWTGVDDVSSVVSFDVQFKRKDDITWQYWLKNTPQLSSQFSSAVSGAGGDTVYQFRSRARDAAGNESDFQNSPEAEVMIDTKAPDSKVAPLDSVQTSLAFTVSWSGGDLASGIESYEIEYRVDGGAWQTWLTGQSGTAQVFTAQAGRRYDFRSIATDRAGNVEAAPAAPDASTRVPSPVTAAPALTAKADPPSDHVTIADDMQGVTGALVTLSLQSAKDVLLKVDEVSFVFYDEKNVPYDARTEKLDAPVTLSSGQSKNMVFFPADMDAFRAFAAKSGVNETAHDLDVTFKGTWTENLPDKPNYSIASNVLRVKARHYKKLPSTPQLLTLTVEAYPTAISYSPDRLSNSVDIKLHLEGPAGSIVTLDEALNEWHNETGQLFASPKAQLSPPVSIAAGETVERKGVKLEMSASSMAKALGGGQQATNTVSLIYSGKDQNGKPVTGKLKTPLTVHYYASTPDWRSLYVSCADKKIDYDPGAAKQPVSFSFNWTSFDELTLTSYSTDLITADKSEEIIHVAPLPQPLALKPGPQTTVISMFGTPVSIPHISVDKTFQMPISVQKVLQGKPQASFSIAFTFDGRDSKGRDISAKTDPIPLNVFSATPGTLAVQLAPAQHTFDAAHLQRAWTADLTFNGSVAATLEEIKVHWHDDGETYLETTEGDFPDQDVLLQPPSEIKKVSITQTVSDYQRIKALQNPKVNVATGYGYKSAQYRMALEFSGTDALQRKISAKSNMVSVFFQDEIYPLTITPSPSPLATCDEFTPIQYTVGSNVPSVVTLSKRTVRVRKGTTLMPLPGYEESSGVTDEIIAFSSMEQIPANGLLVHKTNLHLNLPWLLGMEESAACAAEIIYDGLDAQGKPVQGRVFLPIDVSKPKQASDTSATDPDLYVLIPKVAAVRTISGGSTVADAGTTRTLNGALQLVLYPTPFDSIKTGVLASNLSFKKDPSKPGGWIVTGGSFATEGSQIKPDVLEVKLFKIFPIKVQKITFENSRPDKLLIDKSKLYIPILAKTVYMTNLTLDSSGLNLKASEQEISEFGLTFRLANLNVKSQGGASEVSFSAGVRLYGKPKADELFSAKLTIASVNGKKSIEITPDQSGPIRLIKKTDYLNFESFSFKDLGDDNWVLAATVSSANLPVFSKMTDKIYGKVTFERSGKITGELALIKETAPGYGPPDKTYVTIGSLAAIDLTYLGLVIMAEKKPGFDEEGKPDTSYAISFAQSYVGLSADFYLNLGGGGGLSDTKNRIEFGNAAKPGLSVNFDGDVTVSSVSLVQNKQLDLGPVYVKLTTLGLSVYPSFAIELSGGLGVNLGSAVEGEIAITGLRIDSSGAFTNFAQAIGKGGSLSIMKVVKLGVGNVSYDDKPSVLSFDKSTGIGSQKSSLSVDSYFKIEGAFLSVGENASIGSGGFERLLVFTAQGKTSFILNQAMLNVKNAVELKMDFEYVNLPQDNTKYLAIGGSAKIVQKYEAVVYGKLGEIGGKATFGLFLAVNNLQIPIGPIMLDGLGGGFFYNPVQADIDKVKKLAGFTEPKINAEYTALKPAGSGPGSFAIFLYASITVADENLFKGKALMTVTANYWQLQAEVKALKELAEGYLSVTISWNPEYFEGTIQYGIDAYLIKAEKEDNYFSIYAYSKSKWGVAGKTSITLLYFIKTTTDFYIGSQGFLFDLTFEKSIDLKVISGGIRYEMMLWWRLDVSWGAYAAVTAWGDFLGGLLGAEFGLEGAFIGEPEYVVFAAGHVEFTVLWVISWSGRVWIALGKNGFDGGTGSNSKYDDIINDARNLGKQMKDEMQSLADELAKAREALFALNEAQAGAAGKALAAVMEMDGSFAAAFIKALFMMAFDKERQPKGSYPALDAVYDNLWGQAAAITLTTQKLAGDSAAVAASLNALAAKEMQVRSLLQSGGDLMTGTLPSSASLAKYGSPVGPLISESVDIGGKTQTVATGYSWDGGKAQQLQSGIEAEKQAAETYHAQLLKLAREFMSKLKKIDEILYGGSASVSSLTADYASAFTRISDYGLSAMSAFAARQASIMKKLNDTESSRSQIEEDLKRHVVDRFHEHHALDDKQLAYDDLANGKYDASPPAFPEFDKLINQRVDFVKLLAEAGGAAWGALPVKSDDKLSFKVKAYYTLGHGIWYDIPFATYYALDENAGNARQYFTGAFADGSDFFHAKWNAFTVLSDVVYSRKAGLYLLLYDLLDQLSFEAGTRDESGLMAVQAVIDPAALPGGAGAGKQTVQTGPAVKGSTIQTGAAQQGAAVQKVAAVQPGGKYPVAKVLSGQDWDFESDRKHVKKLLEAPKIKQFTGLMYSDASTPSSARLTLNWSAEHPAGISEYAIDIPGYSQPVSIPGSPPQADAFLDGMVHQISDSTAARRMKPSIALFADVTAKHSAMKSGAKPLAATASLVSALPASTVMTMSGGPPGVWRSVANLQSAKLPFILGVHKPGSREVWLRARGAGGLTIARKGTVNLAYAFAPDPGSGADFGAPVKQSALSVIDSTPPSKPSVHDLADTSDSPKLLRVSWISHDFESGIEEAQYKTATVSKGVFTDVTGWKSAAGRNELNILLDEPMKPGLWYVVKVKAKNGAGLWSEEGCSDGIQYTAGGKALQKSWMKNPE